MSNTKKLMQAASGGGELEAPEELSLYMMGSANYGQTGTGDISYDADISAFTSSGDFTDGGTDGSTVSARSGSYFAIKSNGTCWAWGKNNYGQLGLGDTVNRSSPVQIGTETDFTAVNTSGYHTLFIRGGLLYGAGGNSFGNLGTGDADNRSSPVQIPFSGTPSKICAGQYYTSHVIDTLGKLYASGYNYYGSLGLNDTDNRLSFTQVGTGSDWRSISAASHVLATTTQNDLYAWGRNNYGQFGNLTTTSTSSPVQVAADKVWSEHVSADQNGPSFAIQTNDYVNFLGGRQFYGEGGDGTTANRSSPVVIAYNGNAVATLGLTTIVRKIDGTIHTFGSGAQGYLGDGTWQNRSSPVQVGTSTSWGYPSGGLITNTSDNDLYIWGDVADATGAQEQILTPSLVGSASEWKTASHGLEHSLAIKTDGTLWAWGNNNNYQLGDGGTTPSAVPKQIGSATNWSFVAASSRSSFAINDSGDLYVWGNNSYGVLGTGDEITVTTPTQLGVSAWKAISCSGTHTAGIKADGTLWTWGDNILGQLGNGSTSSTLVMGQRTIHSDYVEVGASQYWTVARRSTGSGIWHAGNSQQGQAGYYTMRNLDFSNTLTSYTFDDIDFGANHLGGRVGRSIYLWGENNQGQIATGSTSSYITPPRQLDGSWFTFGLNGQGGHFIKTDNTLWVTGGNYNGQLGTGDTTSLSTITQVSSNVTWWGETAGAQASDNGGILGE